MHDTHRPCFHSGSRTCASPTGRASACRRLAASVWQRSASVGCVRASSVAQLAVACLTASAARSLARASPAHAHTHPSADAAHGLARGAARPRTPRERTCGRHARQQLDDGAAGRRLRGRQRCDESLRAALLHHNSECIICDGRGDGRESQATGARSPRRSFLGAPLLCQLLMRQTPLSRLSGLRERIRVSEGAIR